LYHLVTDYFVNNNVNNPNEVNNQKQIFFLNLFLFWSVFACTSQKDPDVIILKNLELIDSEGVTTTLNKDSNSIYFINFWATWCKPCIEEMPSIKSLSHVFNHEISFFLLTYEDKDRLQKFEIKKNTELPLYTYSDEALLPEKFRKNVLPYTILIKNNQVIYEWTGATKWDSEKVIEIIKNKIQEN